MNHLVQTRGPTARLHIEAEGLSRARPEDVWELVADASRYCEWGPWSASGYHSPGDPAADGVGAIRWFRYGRTTTVEKVLAAERGRRQVYTVVKGIPVRDYRAEVTLTPTSAGTHILWSATWDRTLGGRIVHFRLRSIYPKIVSHLIAAADRMVSVGPDMTAAE